jgi:quaternary ammonium compound-resistance protein SugE
VAWVYLLSASVLEIGWAIGLKFTEGFTRPVASLLVAFSIAASFFLLARASRDIPIGTAYGVFVGIGAGGTGLLGILVFGESAAVARLLSLAAIVAGVAVLKVFGERPLELSKPN